MPLGIDDSHLCVRGLFYDNPQSNKGSKDQPESAKNESQLTSYDREPAMIPDTQSPLIQV